MNKHSHRSTKANREAPAGVKMRLLINDDPGRVIEFILDSNFSRRFAGMMLDIEAQKKALQLKLNQNHSKQADQDAAREMSAFISGQIDKVFGPGAAATAFGDAANLGTIKQFLDGIAKTIKANRETSKR